MQAAPNPTTAADGTTAQQQVHVPPAGAAAAPAASAAAAPAASPSATAAASASAPGARLEPSLSTALQQLWKLSLLVEQGAAGASAPPSSLDPSLQRLMGMVQPPMEVAELTNQNMHRQLDGFLQSLQQIDRAGRETQLQLPKAILECVEAGYHPSLVTSRFLEETRFRNDTMRARVFATKLLHDQLQVRMERWEEQLKKEAEAGSKSAQIMLDATIEEIMPEEKKQEQEQQ